jgi:uncharacterized membrane protein
MRRNALRRLEVLVAVITDLAAVAALGWLIYQLICHWARLTGRM